MITISRINLKIKRKSGFEIIEKNKNKIKRLSKIEAQ